MDFLNLMMQKIKLQDSVSRWLKKTLVMKKPCIMIQIISEP